MNITKNRLIQIIKEEMENVDTVSEDLDLHIVDYERDHPDKSCGEEHASLTHDEWKKRDKQSMLTLEEIEELLELNALYQSLLAANDVAEVSEQRSKSFAELETVLNDLIYTQLKKPLQQYVKRVNKFLPKGDVFTIEYDKSTFLVGLERGGVVHHALSGSTEARVLAAMAAGLAGTEPSIIVVDDRMWDTQTLAEMMNLLEQANSQVFIMSTLKPRGRQRSAWTYIEMSRDDNAMESEESGEETPVLQEVTEVAEDAERVVEEEPNEEDDEEDILDVLFG